MTRSPVLLLLSLHALAGGALAQEWLSLEGDRISGPVEIRAESVEADENSEQITGVGDVSIVWRGVRLAADKVTFSKTTGVAEAEGDVTLEDDSGNVLQCQRLTIQVESETGEIEEGSLWIAEEGYRVWGKRFRKTGPVSYEVESGGFTTCDGTWPSWRVTASRVDVKLEGYLVARDAAFWVEGVPVAYTPYLIFPVKTKRQSGFLMPKIGYSNRDGILWSLQYYWAMADNADATFGVEYRSRRGWKEELEFRYVLAEGHQGSVEVTHLGDRKEDSNRYTVKGGHRSRFSDATKLGARVDYLSDDTYLKDLGDNLDERSVEFLESYLLATHERDLGTVFTFVDYYQALDATQATTLQTLPSLGILGKETPIAGPLLWEPTVKSTYFWREEGTTGARLEIDPGLALATGGEGFGLSFRTGYRQHLYLEDGDTISRGAARASATAEVDLFRTYGKLVHTVEPKLIFFWEESGRGGDPPTFDLADDFDEETQLRLVIDSRFLRHGDLTTVALAKLEGVFDLEDTDWEPMRGELFWRPAGFLELRADGVYDPSSGGRWLRWSARGEGNDRRGDRIFAGYRFVDDEAKYFDGGVYLALIRALSLSYRSRYSFRDDRMLEETYGASIRHPCWEILLTYSRNLEPDEDRDERRYYVQLNLRGLGKLGSLGGSLE